MKKLATVWLDGCSGCHMSFLDLDERIVELAGLVHLVYSPIMDVKEFPEGVDITLVEGAVGSEEDAEKIRKIRERTAVLVSFGDCAATGNVPAMRNVFPVVDVLKRAYVENATHNPGIPREAVPALRPRVQPVHALVKVDCVIPGCPPSAELIWYALKELLEGRMPDMAGRATFG